MQEVCLPLFLKNYRKTIIGLLNKYTSKRQCKRLLAVSVFIMALFQVGFESGAGEVEGFVAARSSQTKQSFQCYNNIFEFILRHSYESSEIAVPAMHYVFLFSFFCGQWRYGKLCVVLVLQLVCNNIYHPPQQLWSRTIQVTAFYTLPDFTKTPCGGEFLTLPMLRLLLSKHKDVKIFENHLNPVMLIFIG